MIKTRQQYLDGIVSHRDYYSQFVTDNTKKAVLHSIGKEALFSSTDEHMNDIPLHRWDAISHVLNSDALKQAKEGFLTPAGWVCIAKEAGRQIIKDKKQ